MNKIVIVFGVLQQVWFVLSVQIIDGKLGALNSESTQGNTLKYFGIFLSKFQTRPVVINTIPSPAAPTTAPANSFTFISPNQVFIPQANQQQVNPDPTISPDTADFPSFDPDDIIVPRPFPSLPAGVIPNPSGGAGTLPNPSGGSGFLPNPPGSAGTVPNPSGTPTLAPTLPLPTGSQNGLPPGWSSVAQILPGPGVGTQCGCVTAGTCVSVRGAGGAVDLRIVTQNPSVNCAAGQQYCCIQGGAGGSQPQVDTCGLPNILPGVTPSAGQANFGEYPWSGIIMNANTNQYIGGAVLISNSHLLTVAHLVANFPNGAGLKVRLGEWDQSGTYEPAPYTEAAILNIVPHPAFVPTTLQNDLAVITLATPIPLLTEATPQINAACLPAATDTFTNQGCYVAGWGRDTFNGNYQNIIKVVDVPIVGSVNCQNALRTTRLGANWNLDTTSFICAGGELNKDACQGDGGNALVCASNNRFVIAGLTAGGIECGRQGIPGLYVNVASYLPWIIQQIQAVPVNIGIDPRTKG